MWATLPAGLRAARARLHLGIGAARGAPRGDGWVRGMRSPRPFAVRPACQCGGGRTTWSQQATLGDSTGTSADNFGWSVALNSDGSTLLVGAPYMLDYYRQVSAYIFTSSAAPTPTDTPTNTPAPPTSTPTDTPAPPTNTPALPTSTPTPMATASLVVSPTSATPFQTMTLTGTNFAAAESVKLFWDSSTTPLTTAITLASGSFVIHLAVPQAAAGAHSLLAIGQSSGRSASAPLTVKPAVFLLPTHGTAGASATLVGVGFGAGESVAALWYPGLKPLKSGPSNALGTVTLTVTVPLSPTGTYAVLGYGLTSKQYGAASFQVTP